MSSGSGSAPATSSTLWPCRSPRRLDQRPDQHQELPWAASAYSDTGVAQPDWSQQHQEIPLLDLDLGSLLAAVAIAAPDVERAVAAVVLIAFVVVALAPVEVGALGLAPVEVAGESARRSGRIEPLVADQDCRASPEIDCRFPLP